MEKTKQGLWPLPKPTQQELDAAKQSLDEMLEAVIERALDALENGDSDV